MNRENKYTFHELLAGILLEECLMGDRAVQIVDHQVEDGEDLFFSVTGIMGKGCILE